MIIMFYFENIKNQREFSSEWFLLQQAHLNQISKNMQKQKTQFKIGSFNLYGKFTLQLLQGSLKIKRRKLCTYSTLLNIFSWTQCYLMKRNRLLKFPGMYFLILRSCGKISSWVSNLDQKFQHETAQWWSNDQGMFW